jgi:hypothetical protein
MGRWLMKKIIRVLRRKESGQALALALLLLGVGSLVLAPLLSFMVTGLNAGVTFEYKTEELYAADAGVQDAIWKINNITVSIPYDLNNEGDFYTYYLSDINGVKQVSVTILLYDKSNSGTYQVTSRANETEIVAYIGTIWLDYTGIMDNVITSQGDWSLTNPANLDPDEGEPNGPVRNYGGAWPPPEVLAAWYYRDVAGLSPYPSDILDLKDYAAGLGPLLRTGTLSVKNTGGAGLSLQLNGTIYVTGDTQIGSTNQNFTLDLNGHTIFVESDTTKDVTGKYALEIGGKCTLTGSGCIIAVGDIMFKPNMLSSPDDYILVMSVVGTNYMQPNGDFYGTLAGSVEVYIQNGDIHYGDGPPDGLNFPGGGGGGDNVWGIYSYDIHKNRGL